MSLIPKNWSSFQHYKDRSPAWIKLHRGLLDDFAFSRLPVASRALAPLLWLLASEHEEGRITGSIEEIAYRLRMPEKELQSALKPLIDAGFFIDDSALLADCKHDACLEEEREEQDKTEKEKNALDGFEDFWKSYPRTPVMSKKQAKDEWRKLDDTERIAAAGAVQPYKDFLAGKPDHPVVHACRFLSQKRFEGFEATNVIERPMIFVSAESEAFAAWEKFQGRKIPRNKDNGWHFESEWPPGHSTAA